MHYPSQSYNLSQQSQQANTVGARKLLAKNRQESVMTLGIDVALFGKWMFHLLMKFIRVWEGQISIVLWEYPDLLSKLPWTRGRHGTNHFVKISLSEQFICWNNNNNKSLCSSKLCQRWHQWVWPRVEWWEERRKRCSSSLYGCWNPVVFCIQLMEQCGGVPGELAVYARGLWLPPALLS